MYPDTTFTTTTTSPTSSSANTSSSSHYHLLDCFPAPPSFPMSHLRHSSSQPLLESQSQSPSSPLFLLPPPQPHNKIDDPPSALGLHNAQLPYSPPAVISLGDEWTDDDDSSALQSSSSSSSSSLSSPARRLDVFGDSDSYFAFSPASSASSLSPELPTEQLPLWQAEHPRLVSIRDAVLSSERATRYREACLESEVARIKDDLARVQEARARARWVASRADPPSTSTTSTSRRNSSPDPSHASHASHAHPRAQTPPPLVRRASDSDVSNASNAAAASSGWFTYDDDDVNDVTDDDLSADALRPFWDEHYPDPETMLANHLTEARSARAEQRRKRKRDHERIRELGILLSLGSEVRQWEERLAWENAFRPTDPTTTTDIPMDLDHLDDPASPRRRAKSLPTTPPSSYSSSASSLTPPLPPLSASPLWRVSAEMILRRRSLSERPRRIAPPVNANPPMDAPIVDAATGSDSTGTCSSSSSSSSAKRQAVPPPISIPTSTSSLPAPSLRSAPVRPSTLKLSFTLEDLVAPETVVVEKIEEDAREDEEMCISSEESSEASDSDDSRCKSSSSNSSSSENEREIAAEKPLALRRGRSRWSWRKSLQSAQQLQQLTVDMEVDDA